MAARPPTPPRIAEALLRWVLRDEPWLDTTLGDLSEEFASIADAGGSAHARWWYWRETTTVITNRFQSFWRRHRSQSGSRRDSTMRTLFSESRLAARALRRQPLVSAVVVLTLALGLGANAATFGMIDALLLRPFTIPNVDRLIVLAETSAQEPYPQEAVAPGNYADLRSERLDTITRMSTISWWDVNLSGTDQPERIRGSRVGAGLSANVLDDWFSSRNAPTIYVPVDQWPNSQVVLLAKGSGDASTQITGLRAALARVDPSVPAFDTATMREAIRTRTTGLRFVAQLMAAFGVLALVLSAAGIYSVMAHYVAQRRHEIGVRLALGATTRDVLYLTIGSGLELAGLGIVIGLVIGVALARVIEGALFGVIALEPTLFAAITALLAVVALLATLLPARHALAIDPAVALRD